MQNPSLVCGSCGKPVATSEVTCPHCGVLLAAYASPAGSTTAHAYESSEPIADAVPEAEMYVPDPAPPVVIPDKVDVASTAPRPLFDTQLTIEEIAKAAEGDHEESLIVVSEEKVITKPTVFDVPDYAKPPSDAAPVQLVDGGDEELIARAHEDVTPPQRTPVPAQTRAPEPSRAQTPPPAVDSRSEAREPGDPDDDQESDSTGLADTVSPAVAPTPVDTRPEYARPAARQTVAEKPASSGESWLYDLDQSGPVLAPPTPRRERKRRPEPVESDRKPPAERGTTESYLRKLHAESGYEADTDQLSAPVATRASTTGTGWRPGTGTTSDMESLVATRQGCSFLLAFVVIAMWFTVFAGLIGGSLNFGLLFITIVLTIGLRTVRNALPVGKSR